jgi:thiol:disulfide interchange protein
MKRLLTIATLALSLLAPLTATNPVQAAPRATTLHSASEHSASEINWYTEPTEIARVVKAAAADHQPVMLYYHADWCPWCRKMESETFSDSEVARLAQKYVCIKIDTETTFGKKLAASQGVTSYPEVRFYSNTGSVTTAKGYKEADDFVRAMEAGLE